MLKMSLYAFAIAITGGLAAAPLDSLPLAQSGHHGSFSTLHEHLGQHFAHLHAYLPAHGHQRESADASIAGTWNMSLTGDHVVPVGLVLEQNGTRITGTMMIMGRDVALEGEFADGKLTLSGNAQMGDNAGQGGGPMKLTGALKDDGTLAGVAATRHGDMPWTAERLRKRK